MRRLKVAWISDFPIEGLAGAAEEVRRLPRYGATWQRVLLEELIGRPDVELHVVALRKHARQSLSFQWKGVTFHLLSVAGGLRAPTLFWLDTLRLRPLITKIQPDVVHAWGTEKGAATVAQRLGYPYIVTIQGLMTWYR